MNTNVRSGQWISRNGDALLVKSIMFNMHLWKIRKRKVYYPKLRLKYIGMHFVQVTWPRFTIFCLFLLGWRQVTFFSTSSCTMHIHDSPILEDYCKVIKKTIGVKTSQEQKQPIRLICSLPWNPLGTAGSGPEWLIKNTFTLITILIIDSRSNPANLASWTAMNN